ncbi:MAG: hypothetical protein NTX03_09920 [Bacteroidetes bacterium]|nr:hypothetical protein [Bacteroidota bacterium]
MKTIILIFLTCLVRFTTLIASPMSGIYTINPSGSGTKNFTSFTSAVKMLNDSGVNGAVFFNITDGYYNEQIEISKISGASASNTITFQSQSKDSTKVILDWKKTGS